MLTVGGDEAILFIFLFILILVDVGFDIEELVASALSPLVDAGRVEVSCSSEGEGYTTTYLLLPWPILSVFILGLLWQEKSGSELAGSWSGRWQLAAAHLVVVVLLLVVVV